MLCLILVKVTTLRWDCIHTSHTLRRESDWLTLPSASAVGDAHRLHERLMMLPLLRLRCSSELSPPTSGEEVSGRRGCLDTGPTVTRGYVYLCDCSGVHTVLTCVHRSFGDTVDICGSLRTAFKCATVLMFGSGTLHVHKPLVRTLHRVFSREAAAVYCSN